MKEDANSTDDAGMLSGAASGICGKSASPSSPAPSMVVAIRSNPRLSVNADRNRKAENRSMLAIAGLVT